VATRKDLVDKARGLIAAEDIRWFDFCAGIGMIPGNVAHMRGVIEQFAEDCWPAEWEAAG
jgi:hypothetical protein